MDSDGAGPGAAETFVTVYDNGNVWADFNLNGDLIAQYLFGQGLDENVARFRSGEGTAWYLTDHLGSVRDLIDANGSSINRIEYDSFGNILSESNPLDGDRFKFTGREYQAELRLYYYRARFYNSFAGRFISQDPIGFSAGDANLYRYVGNNPLTQTDPTGLAAVTENGVTIQENTRRGTTVAIVGCLASELFTTAAFAAVGIPPDPLDAVGVALCFVNPAAGAADDAVDLAQAANRIDDLDNVRDARNAANSIDAAADANRAGDAGRAAPRAGIIAKADDALAPLAKQFPDAKVGFRGSLARGTKGAHKGGGPFDPTNFDVDAFIVSDDLAAAIPKDAKGFRNLGRLPEHRGLIKSISDKLRGIAGHRDEAVKIRVFSVEEFNKLLPDEIHLLN